MCSLSAMDGSLPRNERTVILIACLQQVSLVSPGFVTRFAALRKQADCPALCNLFHSARTNSATWTVSCCNNRPFIRLQRHMPCIESRAARPVCGGRAGRFTRRGKLKNLDSKTGQMTHILSVDVEDYFQVEAFAGSVSRESWSQWPSRVVANTQRVLDVFDEYNAKATFFFVGWV